MRLWVALLLAPAALLAQQVERGEALFFGEAGCGSCHALKGKGTAVGPNLTMIGKLAPQAVAMAVRSTATQYVQAVKLKSGESFNGMPGPKDDTSVSYFDMGKTPPELRKFAKDDVASATNTDAWKHPPAKIEAAKLADIVAYIRYAATGQKKTVTEDEVR